jgi:AraC family transcriptional regulator
MTASPIIAHFDPLETESQITDLIAIVDHVMANPGLAFRGGIPPRRLHLVVAEIDAHLGERIRIPEIARLANLKSSAFARAFKESTGLSPYKFVIVRRVELARQLLLADEQQTISDVALACGFSSQSHFTDVFTKQVGIAPGHFRREQC